MIEQFVKVWKSNYGNLLFLLALVAASLMSAVWYFNLIPEIQILNDDQPVRVKGSFGQPQGPVHIQVTGPSRTESQPVIHGAVLIFAAEGELLESSTATHMHPFDLDTSGHAFVSLSHSTQSSFAVIAYLDLNSNGRLDFNAGVPAEPWRTSHSSKDLPSTLKLDGTAVTTLQSEPLELKFQFSQDEIAHDRGEDPPAGISNNRE